jgi:hypothetical protein
MAKHSENREGETCLSLENRVKVLEHEIPRTHSNLGTGSGDFLNLGITGLELHKASVLYACGTNKKLEASLVFPKLR